MALGAGVAVAQEGADVLRVGRITVVGEDIFTDEEVAATRGPEKLLRRGMNGLHMKTRQNVLRREVLFAEGEVFDPRLLAETERNLRSLGYLRQVHVTAVDTSADGSVAILVTVRESWTLNTSLGYSRASGGDQRWNVRISERNFLGRGVTLGAGVGQDEDRSYWNLWYRARRLFGQALHLGIDYSETGDGHNYGLSLIRPFYALDDPHSVLARAWDSESDVRTFLSNAGPAGLNPAEEASLYANIPRQDTGAELHLRARLTPRGASRVWRLGLGLRYTDTAYAPEPLEELSDGRYVNLDWLIDGRSPMARDQGTEIFPHLSLQATGRQWAKRRFVLQYGPVEDIPFDPVLDLNLGPSGGTVGSTTNFGEPAWRAEVSASLWRPAPVGLVMARLGGFGVVGDENVRQHSFDAVVGWVATTGAEETPWIARVFAEGAHGSRLNGVSAFKLGLDRGLRTLGFDGMAGDRLVRWNTELGKVSPWEIFGLFRAGGAVFYGGGAAWWDDEDYDLGDARHEMGCGLRFGPTRSASSHVARIDVTWALDGSEGPVLTATTRGYF